MKDHQGEIHFQLGDRTARGGNIETALSSGRPDGVLILSHDGLTKYFNQHQITTNILEFLNSAQLPEACGGADSPGPVLGVGF